MKRLIKYALVFLSTCCVGLGLALMLPLKSAPLTGVARDYLISRVNIVSTTTGSVSVDMNVIISGGRISVRASNMTLNPINVRLPNARGGCGGIDLFGGSFSFANSAQWTQLAQNISSNALGYLFTMGLDAVCPACMSNINKIQKSLQSLNETNLNSCQLAQGIVTDGPLATAKQGWENLTNVFVSATAGADDYTQARNQDTKAAIRGSTNSTMQSELDQYIGNITYKALENNNVGSWWPDSRGGAEWRETKFQSTRPTGIRDVGTIEVPSGDNPSVSGRDWLAWSETYIRRGSIYQVTTVWKLSGRNGWDSDIYD